MRRSAIATSCVRARRWRHTRLSDGRTIGLTDWEVLVDPVGRPGAENMSRDEALLDRVVQSGGGGAFLRLYRWDPPTLSIGRNQRLDTPQDVPVVRRPTGGKAVWHDDEVTYAVAAPIALFGSLRNAYCEIHTRLARALRFLGVAAILAPYRPTVRPLRCAQGRLPDGPISCFAHPVGGEILARGRKLVGSAQVRRGAALLQHGSILLGGTQPGDGLETTLSAELGRAVSFDEVTQAVIEHWPSVIASTAPA